MFLFNNLIKEIKPYRLYFHTAITFYLTEQVGYDNIPLLMNSIGEKLIELRIATRYACYADKAAAAVTLRTKLLYLLSQKSQTPPELMTKLCMVKSNLAILCSKAESEELIVKRKLESDRRVVSYSITPKGRNELNKILNALENEFKRILTTEKEYNEGITRIDAVLHLLSFL